MSVGSLLLLLLSTNASSSSILYLQQLEALGYIDCAFNSTKEAPRCFRVLIPSFVGNGDSQLVTTRHFGVFSFEMASVGSADLGNIEELGSESLVVVVDTIGEGSSTGLTCSGP